MTNHKPEELIKFLDEGIIICRNFIDSALPEDSSSEIARKEMSKLKAIREVLEEKERTENFTKKVIIIPSPEATDELVEKIVNKIVVDIQERKGIGDEWLRIANDDIAEEIIADWKAEITKLLQTHMRGER